MRRRTWITGALLLLAGCLDPIPPDTLRARTGAIEGEIRNFCNNEEAIGGVAAKVYRIENGTVVQSQTRDAQYTDVNGRFLIDGLEPGSWQLNLSRTPGYKPTAKVITIDSDQTVRVALTLTPVLPKKEERYSTVLDVLFVIDNSSSMLEEQQELARAFPAFMNPLSEIIKEYSLDVRLGVISTDMGAGRFDNMPSCGRIGGDKGKLQHVARTPGCPLPTDPFISAAGGRTNVEGGTINDAFSCIVELGTGGCAFEQPLAATLAAIDSTIKINPDFPRESSVLAVVVLSDEDDCSADDDLLFNPQSELLGQPTSYRCFNYGVTCDVNDPLATGPRENCTPSSGPYHLPLDTFIEKLREGRGRHKVFFAAITGRADKVEVVINDKNQPALKPSCLSPSGSAFPGIRLKAVADKMKPHSSFDSICNGDLGLILEGLANQIAYKAIFNPCK
jgi:hypothetical protein